MRKLFDSSKKKSKLKKGKAPKRHRSSEYTYSELYNMTNEELQNITTGGTSLRNRDEARGILKERAKMRLATYGY
jgi:hypothetical protein